jgi:hypothetical protein
MRLLPARRRGISPVLVLLLASSVTTSAALFDERSKPGSVEHLASDKLSKGPLLDLGAPVQKSDTGTKDAPVDGLDGKPHAGPFVVDNDILKKPGQHVEDVGSIGAGTKKSTFDTPIDDDGVMLKDKGLGTPKGPTGIEGGVSQKDKDRKEGKAPSEKTPEQPKEASMPAGGKSSVTASMDEERKKGAAGLEVR